MKRKVFSVILYVFLLIGFLPIQSYADEHEEIIILYENDVHCNLEGYSKLSALKKELLETHKYVAVVSSGDYIQGSSLGVVSKGEYVIELMNLIGYDALTLGNHEFDYKIERLNELVSMMDTKPVSANFQKIGEDTSYFDPYTIIAYGDTKIAYIGMTTPSTITSSSPAQFKDENNEFIYTFHPTDLEQVLQSNIDQAKKDGADYIIALTHLGDDGTGLYANIREIISNTSGLDVVLDGHSHSVIEQEMVLDQDGKEVLLSSTGTKFEYVGQLTLKDGSFTSKLIPLEEYPNSDPVIDAYLEEINETYAILGDRVIAHSEVDLIYQDEHGNRLVRNSETNLGDFCADAFRHIYDADIAYINGGNLRADIKKGDITYNDLLTALPYNNVVVLAEVDAQIIKDVLEYAMMNWPEEGSFPHVSGIRFSLNRAIDHSIVINEHEEFMGVDGERRVYDIQVYNDETQKYEALDESKTYTFVCHNYYLLEYGSGMTMFKDATILDKDGPLDVEVVELYILDELDGVIGDEYKEMEPSIFYTDGFIETESEIPYLTITISIVVLLVMVLIIYKKFYKK